jgi:signal transduction histidine kinase
MLPFFAAVLAALVIASAVQTDPRPALHGRGLLVLAALIGYLGALGYGVVYRTRLDDPPTGWRLLGLVAACALVLAIVQPEGAGTLALYITLGVACSRLPPRRAIPGFTIGIVGATVLRKLLGPEDTTWGDLVIADASAIIFFYLGYIGRQFRLGQDRAERMVEELEAGREAQAAAIMLRERGRTAREMHDVLAHSLSALAVQLEGTRLLARSTDADPAVVEAVERSHKLAKEGLEEARRAIDALRGGEMPGPDRLPALADAFREQTGVPVRLATDGAPRELPPDARLAIYRTAQEALTNVRRHAAAERVDLRLRYADDGTWLTVEDHGRPANGSAESGLGYGLTGMRERAELLDGRLAADRTRDGFRVELYIPQPR